MKVTPIAMSSPMVRALLADAKTQTRRLIRPQLPSAPEGYCFDAYNDGPLWCWWTPDHRVANSLPMWTCPFGKPGDLLYVKEDAYFAPNRVAYVADNPPLAPGERVEDFGRKRPARFMPRWSSRLTLDLVTVRVQRLQQITEEDAAAEGVFTLPEPFGGYGLWTLPDPEPPVPGRIRFAHLWNRLHPEEGRRWADDPWIVALSFKVHKCNVLELMKRRAVPAQLQAAE